MRDAATPEREADGMDGMYRDVGEAFASFMDKAGAKGSGFVVAGVSFDEGEPGMVFNAEHKIPDDETAMGMIALLLFSLAGRFEDSGFRLMAVDAVSEWVKMLVEHNPDARSIMDVADFGDGLPDLPASPVQ